MTTTDQVVSATSFRPGEFQIDDQGHGHLLASRSLECGVHFFPVRRACAGCLSTALETVRLSGEGTLYTYTVVHQSTPDFEVPYMLGYVDLLEGVRVMGQMTGYEFDVALGTAMRLEVVPFGRDDEGSQLLGYRFVPVVNND